ncbi:MAG: hypothetical protein LKE41_03950 [Prevotella sp.]|nr:hypothetical protein [Prevotella sp.]
MGGEYDRKLNYAQLAVQHHGDKLTCTEYPSAHRTSLIELPAKKGTFQEIIQQFLCYSIDLQYLCTQ